jgi:glucose-1-phosphate adenylyltransferase
MLIERGQQGVGIDQQQRLRRTVALVLAGGRGSRLRALTDWHSKPALPFAGKFRIIDFTLSNCINSGIRRIGLLTQYKAHSLIQHIQRGWGFLRGEFNEFIELLPAQQRVEGENWYRGTADAIFQNLDILRDHDPAFVLILAGDHIYKMDYGRLIETHCAHGAEVTVACIEVPVDQAKNFGVMAVDEHDTIVRFQEKPDDPETLPGHPDRVLASMGIYVFNAQRLYDLLEQDACLAHSAHDFGKDVIPALIGRYRVKAHRFEESCVMHEGAREHYWRDVGTIDAYWEANTDLTTVTPALNLYDENWPIWTYQAQLPPAKFVFDNDQRRGMAVDSLVSGGCVISGATARRSLLYSNVRVNSYATVEDSVLLPDCDIGRHARLRRCIVDAGCRIPSGLVVGENADLDASRFYVSERGVTLITSAMLDKLESSFA